MLDIRTMLFAVGGAYLTQALLLEILHRTSPLPPAMRMFLSSRTLLGCGFMMLAAREHIPDMLSIWVGNGLLIMGTGVEVAALGLFAGIHMTGRRVATLLAVLMVPWIACFITDAVTGTRVVVFGLTAGICYGLIGLWLWRRQFDDRALSRMLSVTYLAMSAIFLVRAVYALVHKSELMDPDVVQVLTVSIAFVASLVCSYGFLLLAKADADRAMARLAMEDDLTGALNGRTFREQATAALRLAERLGHPVSLLMLDLDRFKSVNDTYGHATGDAALRQFSHCCRDTLRNTDLFGRIGGEEFTVLLPGTGAEGAASFAERLRRNVEARPTPTADGTLLCVTVSIGTVTARAEESLDSLLARADLLLYAAKRAGRNIVRSDLSPPCSPLPRTPAAVPA
ncbi:MAG: hypothetical protein RLY86_471 [Pseudomonadota bacterium]|jgi:diguanylate cyclase (GGDEF)-like protein